MTFSLWLKRFGARTGKAVLSCSLLAATLGLAVDYGDVARRLRAAPGNDAKTDVLEEVYRDPDVDFQLRERLGLFLEGTSYGPTVEQVTREIELRAFAQSAHVATKADKATDRAKKIKASPLYRDPGIKESSNWLAQGFSRLGEWLSKLINRPRPEFDAPDVNVPSGLGDIIRVVVWLLLTGILALFLWFVAKHFRWRQRLERRARALLEEDEPERSRDEYLEEANRLAAEGRYREAIRCLYLACLLLFDENNVARFIRGQTNWEHLRRINASPTLPAGVDFMPATMKFDLVWYGMQVRGADDLEAMRGWYLEIQDQLRSKAA